MMIDGRDFPLKFTIIDFHELIEGDIIPTIFIPQFYQCGVDHEAMEPRAERGFATEEFELAGKSEKNLLYQVICVGLVFNYSEANEVNPSAVKCIELPERSGISLLRAFDKRILIDLL